MKKVTVLLLIMFFALFPLNGCKSTSNSNYGQKTINQISAMPQHASNYKLIDYMAKAQAVDEVLYYFANYSENIPYNNQTFSPIGFWDDTFVNTNERSFGFPAYIGSNTANIQGTQEGITVLGSIFNSSLIGIDKSKQKFDVDGKGIQSFNFVRMLEEFYNTESGINFILDNKTSPTGQTFWYEIFPQILFARIYRLYPDETWMEDIIMTGAENWHNVLPEFYINGNWNFAYKSYNFVTNTLIYGSDWNEPPNGGLAYIFYNAYLISGDEKYLDDCKIVLDYIQNWNKNSYYEILQDYACYVASILNLYHGTSYDIQKFVNVSFEGSTDFRSGAQVTNAKWGDYDAYGLLAFEYSDTSGNGYAFAMNTFHMVGTLLPMLNYDSRFANAVGKWLYHMTNSARLFYGDEVPLANQSCPTATDADPTKCISYEGVKGYYESKSPYSMGDPTVLGWGNTDYGIYGGVHVGTVAASIQKTNVEQIIRADLNVCDTLGKNTIKKYLYYNPYSKDKTVEIELDENCSLYNTITNSYILQNITGKQKIVIPANGSVIVAILKTSDNIEKIGNNYYVGDEIIKTDKPTVNIISPNVPKSILSTKTVIDLEYYACEEDTITNMKVSIGEKELYNGLPKKLIELDCVTLRKGIMNLKVEITTATGANDMAMIRVRNL